MFHFFEKVNKRHLKTETSTIEHDQILLYDHFNKIVEGLGTGFEFPALGQKLVRNIHHTAHSI